MDFGKSKGGSLFGAPSKPSAGSLFPQKTDEEKKGGLFGSSSASESKGNLFGGNKTEGSGSSGLFGQQKENPKPLGSSSGSGNMFGGNKPAETKPSTGLFQSSESKPASNPLFTKTSGSGTGLFNQGVNKDSQPGDKSKSLFGGQPNFLNPMGDNAKKTEEEKKKEGSSIIGMKTGSDNQAPKSGLFGKPASSPSSKPPTVSGGSMDKPKGMFEKGLSTEKAAPSATPGIFGKGPEKPKEKSLFKGGSVLPKKDDAEKKSAIGTGSQGFPFGKKIDEAKDNKDDPKKNLFGGTTSKTSEKSGIFDKPSQPSGKTNPFEKKDEEKKSSTVFGGEPKKGLSSDVFKNLSPKEGDAKKTSPFGSLDPSKTSKPGSSIFTGGSKTEKSGEQAKEPGKLKNSKSNFIATGAKPDLSFAKKSEDKKEGNTSKNIFAAKPSSGEKSALGTKVGTTGSKPPFGSKTGTIGSKPDLGSKEGQASKGGEAEKKEPEKKNNIELIKKATLDNAQKLNLDSLTLEDLFSSWYSKVEAQSKMFKNQAKNLKRDELTLYDNIGTLESLNKYSERVIQDYGTSLSTMQGLAKQQEVLKSALDKIETDVDEAIKKKHHGINRFRGMPGSSDEEMKGKINYRQQMSAKASTVNQALDQIEETVTNFSSVLSANNPDNTVSEDGEDFQIGKVLNQSYDSLRWIQDTAVDLNYQIELLDHELSSL